MKIRKMSGEAEIEKWVEDNGLIIPDDSLESNYDAIAAIFDKDNRLPLDDILLDEKSKFESFIERQLITPSTQTEPPEAEPTGFIKIRAFSYIRNGKVINVPSHQRRKRK